MHAPRSATGTRAWAWALRALLVVPGIACGASAGDAKPLTAILVVARAQVNDPNFSDAVVLVMNNLGPAPVGIIVNRPTPIPVARLFPQLKHLGQLPDKIYFGGPVEIESVWFLFHAAKPPEHAVRAFEGVYLSTDRATLLRLLGRDKPMDGLRIFIGHSGWGPGQLETEIARGDWKLEHADSSAIFNGKSDHPWPTPHNADGEEQGSPRT